jgi:hypothetical protein
MIAYANGMAQAYLFSSAPQLETFLDLSLPSTYSTSRLSLATLSLSIHALTSRLSELPLFLNLCANGTSCEQRDEGTDPPVSPHTLCNSAALTLPQIHDAEFLHPQQVTSSPEASALGHGEICVCLEEPFHGLGWAASSRWTCCDDCRGDTAVRRVRARSLTFFTCRDNILDKDPCQATTASCHDLRISSTCHAVATCMSGTAAHTLRSMSGDTPTLLAGA